MRPLDEREHELVADVLSGERAETDPEVVDLMLRTPGLREELMALRAVSSSLEAAGSESRREIGDAQRVVSVVDVAAAACAIGGGRRGLRRRSWVALATVAALILLLLSIFVWPRPSITGIGGGNPWLGPHREDVRIEPSGESRCELFRWWSTQQKAIVPSDGSLKVVIFRVRDGRPTDEIVLEKPELDGSEWQPSPQELEKLRQEGDLIWELREVDYAGRENALQSATVHVLKVSDAAPSKAGRRPVEELSSRMQELGRTASQDAVEAMYSWFEEAGVRRTLHEDREGVLTAIGAGRKDLGDSAPFASRAWFERNVAGFLLALDLQESALDTLRRFFVDREESRAPVQAAGTCAEALTVMAQLEHAKGEFDAAIDLAQRAQRLTDGSCLGYQADALGIEARVWIELGVPTTAHELLVRQQRLLTQLGSKAEPFSKQEACLVECEYFLKQERGERAVAALDRLGTDLSAIPALDLKRNLALIGIAERVQREDLDAEAKVRQALQVGGVERGFASSAHVMLFLAAMQRDDLATARVEVDALRSLHGSSDAKEPMHWRGAAQVEALETRLLLRDHKDHPGDGKALREQLVRHRMAFDNLLAEWEHTKVRRGGIGFLAFAHRRQTITELIRLTQALDGDEAAAKRAGEDLLRTQRLTSLAREVGVPDVTLTEVRDAFAKPGAGVLVFLADPNGSLLLALDAVQTKLIALPSSYAIDAKVREMQAALTAAVRMTDREGAEGRLRKCAWNLSHALLTPEVRDLLGKWDTVTIADYGMLSGLPWECLEWTDGVLLGERMAINMLTSLPVGVAMLKTRYAPTVGVIPTVQFFGTLCGSSDLVDRVGSGEKLEMARIRRMLGACTGPEPILNQDATVAAVGKMKKDATVTHVLAHGAQIDQELATGLALAPAHAADQGFFGCDQVGLLDISGIVILSACGAGRIHCRIGDEPLYATLGGAFVRAGAHTVVQSSADLRLESHLRLMEAFYAGLAAGKTTCRALSDARAGLASSSDWIDRYEHAQVQVFGIGHVTVVK